MAILTREIAETLIEEQGLDIVIPSIYTSIEDSAFYDSHLKSITIPEGVVSIGNNAFEDNDLERVVIPNSVISIGDWVFHGNQLTSILISEGIAEIGKYAFSDNELTSVTIPSSTVTLGEDAFSYNKLTNVVINPGISMIGNEAFGDNQLTNIVIPDGVIWIGEKAFEANKLTSVIIPDSVTTIDASAFENNQLKSVVIGSSVSTIGEEAFSGNELTDISIPDNVTAIEKWAFNGNQLTNVVIGNGVKSIGEGAFLDNKLTSAVIGESVATIEEDAFRDNPQLKEITIYAGSTYDLSIFPYVAKINVTGSKLDPTNIEASNLGIDENIEVGTSILSLETSDPEGRDIHTYSLVSGTGDTDNNVFAIDGDQLKIVNSPNFEIKDAYSIRIRTTDSGGLTFEKEFALSVNDINEQPVDLNISATSFDENIPSSSIIATLSSEDPDFTDDHTYSLVPGQGDIDNNAFTVSGNQLSLWYFIGSPDYETKSSYSIRLQTKDKEGLTFEKAFTLDVNDLPEYPVLVSLDQLVEKDEVVTYKLEKPVDLGTDNIGMITVGTNQKDKITGTSEGEILAGQDGKDSLKGKGGPDGFLINASNGFGKKQADVIKDFNSDEGDVLLVDKDVFGLSDEFEIEIVTGKKASKKASKSNNDFVYDDKKGLLFFNENGEDKGWGDGGLFAKLQGAPELDASDFTIV